MEEGIPVHMLHHFAKAPGQSPILCCRPQNRKLYSGLNQRVLLVVGNKVIEYFVDCFVIFRRSIFVVTLEPTGESLYSIGAGFV